MQLPEVPTATLPPYRHRFAMCLAASKRVRWDIERDLLRGRQPDAVRPLLPRSLTGALPVDGQTFAQRWLADRIQARTYAQLAARMDRAMAMQALPLAATGRFDDELAAEAVVRMADEKLKHQDLFERLDRLLGPAMPAGYGLVAVPPHLPQVNWPLLALSLLTQLAAQAHYRASLAAGDGAHCELWRDVLLFHWKEEAQHAVLTEEAWRREHHGLSELERDRAVDALLALLQGFEGQLRLQAGADADYFLARHPGAAGRAELAAAFLAAYRCQHIGSGLLEPRFGAAMQSLLTPWQWRRWNARGTAFAADCLPSPTQEASR